MDGYLKVDGFSGEELEELNIKENKDNKIINLTQQEYIKLRIRCLELSSSRANVNDIERFAEILWDFIFKDKEIELLSYKNNETIL